MTDLNRRSGWGIAIAVTLAFSNVGRSSEFPPGIIIEKSPPTLERRVFDPKHPPADMPKLTPPETAVCAYRFECSTGISVMKIQTSDARVRATVNSVTMVSHLEVVIWLPKGASKKVKEHEDAHLRIGELYYANAEPVLLELAHEVLGRELPQPVGEDSLALRRELHALQQEVSGKFMQRIANRCEIAQIRFDAITDHSANAIATEEAVVRALADERAQRSENSDLSAKTPRR